MIALILAAALVAPRPLVVTVDDLPLAADELHPDPADRARVTGALLDALAAHHIAAVGFVTGMRVHGPADEALLARWIAGGHELGNHTTSHLHLNSVPLADWTADAEAERRWLEHFLAAHQKKLRFFRFPFLEEGDSPEKFTGARQYLAASGQKNLSPTIDDQDWSYEKPYVEARRAHDEAAARRAEEDFLAALRAEAGAQEERGDALAGERTPQILLLHATEVGAAVWDRLFTWLEENGHRFVTADAVLADPALAADSTWVGPYGFGLWDRLAATKREEKALREVAALLAAQAKDWTAGDLEGFCSIYADDASFVSPTGVTRGREAVLARYKKKYPDAAAMGALSLEVLESRAFAGVEVTELQDARPGHVQAVSVVARWTLRYPDKPAASGTTQLVLRPRGHAWEIVSDASM